MEMILPAADLLQPLVEFIFAAIFNHNPKRNLRFARIGLLANMTYWSMQLSLLLASLVYLIGGLPDVVIVALIASLISLAVLVPLEFLIWSKSGPSERARSPDTLSDNPLWIVPASVISFWVFASSFKGDGQHWFTALAMVAVAAACVTGFVKVMRHTYR